MAPRTFLGLSAAHVWFVVLCAAVGGIGYFGYSAYHAESAIASLGLTIGCLAIMCLMPTASRAMMRSAEANFREHQKRVQQL